MKRIEGLDSIRFVLAFIVLVGHMGLPLPDFVYFDSVYLINLLKLFGLIFNGPAAGIIFFILSGFVIHYPFIENYNKFNIKKF
jgi:peptidoglycan/LPS O-acetylase OafA/YrhL